VRQADHAEQRVRLGFAVDAELGVEDLVPAVLAVDLREHHQLGVGRIAAGRCVVLREVGDLVIGQRQAPVTVRGDQCIDAAGKHVNPAQAAARLAVEDMLQIGGRRQHRFHHWIVQQRVGRFG
jgi:hypothetical protein